MNKPSSLRLKYFAILFLLFSAITNNVSAQQFVYKVFDNRNGLNTPEILSVFADSRGFLWVGGLDGITRFDGKLFKNYSNPKGSSYNLVYSISEKSDGDLMIGTRRGISFFDGKTFKNIPIKNEKGELISSDIYFQCVFEASNHKIYAGSTSGFYVYNQKKNAFYADSRINCFVSEIAEDELKQICITTERGLRILKDGEMLSKNIDQSIGTNSLTGIKIDDKNTKWISTTKGIVKCTKKDTIKWFTNIKSENFVHDILLSKKNGIVFCGKSSTVRILKNNIFQTFDLKEFVGFSDIIKVVEDRQGNIWLASQSALIKMYEPNFKKHILSDSLTSMATSLALGSGNTIYIGTPEGLINYDGKRIKRFTYGSSPSDQIISSLTYFEETLYIGTYSGQVLKLQNDDFIVINEKNKADDCVYRIVPFSKEEFWFCKSNKVVHLKNGETTNHNVAKNKNIFTQDALKDKKGNIWFANLSALSLLQNDLFSKPFIKSNYSEFVSLAEDKNGFIWVGTYGNGLLRIEKGKLKQMLTVKNGLCNDFIASTYFDSCKNVLWVGTMYGISKITLDKHSNIKVIKNIINNPDSDAWGCIQNAVLKLPNGNILFSIGDGLYEYDYNNDIDDDSFLSFQFDGMLLNNEKLSLKKQKEFKWDNWTNTPLNPIFSHDENNIKFEFSAVDFNNSHTLKYKWKLNGFDGKWSQLSENAFVSFTNLYPGEYTLYVVAENHLNQKSKILLYKFSISPPFYKTYWFIFCMFLAGFSIIYLIFLSRVKKIKKAEKLKTANFKKLAEVELKALRAQMNPHFMFNTLNSIQDIVLSKDDVTARIYLADFAKMMRMILENSTQKSISLEKEIEFIQLYLQFELIRFNDKFICNLTVSEDLNLYAIQIPPMFIQPYIENAINHGLMHKIEGGILNISIDLIHEGQKEYLKCTILDNGIGRQKSAELNAWKDHKSMSNQITNDRIELLNSIANESKYKVTISNLTEENEDSGTKVEIFISLN